MLAVEKIVGFGVVIWLIVLEDPVVVLLVTTVLLGVLEVISLVPLVVDDIDVEVTVAVVTALFAVTVTVAEEVAWL